MSTGEGTLPAPASTRSIASSSMERGLDGSRTATGLDTLLDYLLASKRSLSSTTLVWRANEIVHGAREALTEGVVLRARAGFLRQAMAEQWRLLARIQHGIEQAAGRGQADFEATLRELDDADARLQATVDVLQSTVVERSMRPADEGPRSLHHFVDEQNVERLKSGLKESIDQVQEAQRALRQTIQDFSHDLHRLQHAVEAKAAADETRAADASMLPILPSLESHAKEMADLLESLVRHFDLCVTALKHTEGGAGAVAAHAVTTDDRRPPAGAGAAAVETMGDEERGEMLDVLGRDAAELEDVVLEIRDRLAEMEAQSDDLTAFLDRLAASHAEALAAFELLEDVGTRLRRYVRRSRESVGRWHEHKSRIRDRMQELDGLRDFYDHFAAAYDDLLIEIGHRRDTQKKVQAVVKDAMASAFRHDQGDYLPSDIWPGLMSPPIRYEIVPLDMDAGSIPDISRKLIEQATRRAHHRL
ncbi:MAG: autophagy protein 17 [Phylliscum demangeonii]|nr:MAG: autophagy protein 17 [Phylliscum demangeonii]